MQRKVWVGLDLEKYFKTWPERVYKNIFKSDWAGPDSKTKLGTA